MQQQPTREPLGAEIITHLQMMLETVRISLSRELHDDMGGLLVAAMMDVAWVEQNRASLEEARKKLERVRRTLSAAIDLKRRLIEELRPTLLDNFGLFAALRWHVKHTCEKARVTCTGNYPTKEPPFTADALTGLFRILQETLEVTLQQPSIHSLAVMVKIDGDVLTIRLSHDAEMCSGVDAEKRALAMAAMKHRARLLGGKVSIRALKKGGQVLTMRVPFRKSLRPH
jgi:signal transduction histidine kinase